MRGASSGTDGDPRLGDDGRGFEEWLGWIEAGLSAQAEAAGNS